MKRIISAILCFALLLCMTACFNSDKIQNEINLYFKGSSTNELIVEPAKYTGSQNIVDMANFAIEKLNAGPEDEDLRKTLPENVTFGKVAVKNEIATVDFSDEFTSLTGVDELLARFSVVRTLCDIPGISNVLITVNSMPLISNSTGNEVGMLSKKDIVLDVPVGSQSDSETTVIQLYFANSDLTALKAEPRKVTTADTVSIERTIVNELMKGPASHELTGMIPSGTKLQNVETRDGVCYVNFSEDFVSRFAGGTNTGMLIVYSIVNSLCSLENIESVQILIEGEKGATFGDFIFDEPIEKKMSIVQKN